MMTTKDLIFTNDKEIIVNFLNQSKGTYERIKNECPENLSDFTLLVDQLIQASEQQGEPAFILGYESKTAYALKRWVREQCDEYPYGIILKKLGFLEGTQLIFRFKNFHNTRKKDEPTEQFLESIICHEINITNGIDPKYSAALTYEKLSHTKSYEQFWASNYQSSKTLANRKQAIQNIAEFYKGHIMVRYDGIEDERDEWKAFKELEYKLGLRKRKSSRGAVKTDIYDKYTHDMCTSIKTNASTQLASMGIAEQGNFWHFYSKDKTIKISKADRIMLDKLFDINNIPWFVFTDTIKYISAHHDHPQYKIYQKIEQLKHDRNLVFQRVLKRNLDLYRALIIDALTGKSKYKESSSAIPQYFLHIIPTHPELTTLYTLDEFLDKYLPYTSCSLEWKSNGGGHPAFISLRVYLNTTISDLKEIHKKEHQIIS